MIQTEVTSVAQSLDSQLEQLGDALERRFSEGQPQVKCQLVRRVGDGTSLSILLTWYDAQRPKTLVLYAQRCTRRAGRFEVVCPDLQQEVLRHGAISMDDLNELQLTCMTQAWILSGAYREIGA